MERLGPLVSSDSLTGLVPAGVWLGSLACMVARGWWPQASWTIFYLRGMLVSTNHFQILANREAWVVTLSGEHFATCASQAEAYEAARRKIAELGSGEIFVHDAAGDLESHEEFTVTDNGTS